MKRRGIVLGIFLAVALNTPLVVHATKMQTVPEAQPVEVSVETATVLDAGVWNNISWTMYSDGSLLLEAQGETDAYTFNPAWLTDYAETITSAKIVGNSITSTNGWFRGCSNLTNLDTSEWDMSGWESATEMFRECTSLQTLQVSDWDTGDLKFADWMFYKCTNLETLDVSNWDMSSLMDAIDMFRECSSLTSLDVGDWGCTSLRDISQMFADCTALESVNPGSWDISGLSQIDMLFSGCESLKTLELNEWDTSNLHSISGTFQGCKSLETVSLSNWDTTEVRDIGSLFDGCENLKNAEVSDWNLPNVTDIRYLFYDCKSLTEVDLSNWTLGEVDRAFCMFYGCENLESVTVGDWDLSPSTQLSGMFRDCKKLKTLDISGWTTGVLTHLDYMFSGCESLESLMLPDWDTGSVVVAEYLFYNCQNLDTEIEFDGVNLEYLTSMFQGCGNMTVNLTLGRYEAIYDAENCFTDAATAEDAAIYVTYSGVLGREEVEQIIASKSENSHIYITEVAPEGFEIQESKISIEVGGSYIIDLSMTPANANGTVWCSDVDSVSADGTDGGVVFYKVDPYNRKVYIEGLKEGIVSLDIYVRYGDNVIYLQDNCIVEVGNPSETCTTLKKITLVPEEVTLTTIGESLQLNVELFPEYAAMPELEWTEYNGVVTVNDAGLITAVKNGEGYVYAVTKDGSMSTSCTIYVEDMAAVVVPVTGMSFDRENLLLTEIGESYQLTPVFTPANATNKSVEWLSGDSSVATVDANGVVTAVSEGTTQIYAWALDGMYQAICNVRVDKNGAQVKAFVERMYTVALNRDAEASGVAFWVGLLQSGASDGEDIAIGFFTGEEFIGRNLNNEDYLETLYATFFDREADEEGWNYNMNLLENGISRNDVLNVFINSAEFDALCKSYGIEAVYTQEELVTRFVQRMYTVALNRTAEAEGVAHWVGLLLGGDSDGEDIAVGFFNGEEFVGRSLNNEDYLNVLYATFFDREADAEGWAYNMNLLRNGVGRDVVLNIFINSTEFEALCTSYGIEAVYTREELVRKFVDRMYTEALGRASEEEGAAYWTAQLVAGNITGAKLADDFISGVEFTNRGLSDREYVEVLYATFFDRAGAEADIDYWEAEAAKDKNIVLLGFVYSAEFEKLCESYGIIRGEL